jgi:hypothetical protein
LNDKKEEGTMAIAAFKRYEIKFIITKKQFDALLPELLEHMRPDPYCTNGRDYCIYNIYYDTDDNEIIRSSLSKPYYKEKLRLRSYSSPTPDDGEVFLEIKKKTGGIVHKRRAVMTLKDAYTFIETGEPPSATTYINKQVVSEIDFFLHQNKVHPAAYIGYCRRAFFGKDDKNFRITFDYNIQTRREDVCLKKKCRGETLLDDDQFLMEVKIPGAVPLWLADLLSDLQIYKTSFSKYGTEYARSKIIC